MDSAWAIQKLRDGLERDCADDIIEVLCNLGDGTCDYVELIPVLERVAANDSFYYFDDNGAGGYPHPTGKPSSFGDWARGAIANIRENAQLGGNSPTAKALKSIDTDFLRTTLDHLGRSQSTDESLIPILEKIAKKDKYDSYSYYGGYGDSSQLGDLARTAIQRIRNNVERER